MDSRLPLKLQLAIRELWEREDASVQMARKELEETLGCGVLVAPEWVQLLAELERVHEDHEDLVAVVSSCVAVWLKVLKGLVAGADYADAAQHRWLEMLQDRTRLSFRLQCFIEIAKTAGTIWSDGQAAFTIRVPNARSIKASVLAAAFQGDILRCFDEEKPKDLTNRLAGEGGSDDWADVNFDQTTGSAVVVDKKTAPAAAVFPKSRYLPTLASIPQPATLFCRPPYYLSVLARSCGNVQVQCSHSPSLQLLGDYLTRWCRVDDDSTQAPTVDVQLRPSCWASGTFNDRLTLTSAKVDISPAIILAFVDGVLGYDPVPGTTWTFRRDVEFKQ